MLLRHVFQNSSACSTCSANVLSWSPATAYVTSVRVRESNPNGLCVPSQQYQLSVMDLTVQTSADGSATEAVSLQHLASWIHPGLITALQVGPAILPRAARNMLVLLAHRPDHGGNDLNPVAEQNFFALPLRQVVDFRRGEVVIYTGTAEGAVCRLRLQVPVSPGAAVADIKVQKEAI